jgi:hypothetical protein
MTNSERDPGYQAWITGLMTGTASDADRAARAKFRAMQAAPPPVTARPAAVASTGPNTWAVSDRSDGLTQFTHLAGPGIPGLIAAR